MTTLIELAEQSTASADWASALAGWERAQSLSPNGALAIRVGQRLHQARLQRARQLRLEGSLDEAEALLDRVLARRPDHGRALVEKAEVATTRGNWDTAVARWRAALSSLSADDRTRARAVGRLQHARIHRAGELAEQSPETAAKLVLTALQGPPSPSRPTPGPRDGLTAAGRAAHMLAQLSARPTPDLLARHITRLRSRPHRPVAEALTVLLKHVDSPSRNGPDTRTELHPAVLSACLILKAQSVFRAQEVPGKVYEQASACLRRAQSLGIHESTAREVLIELDVETWRHDEVVALYPKVKQPSLHCTRQYARVLMETGRHEEAKEVLTAALDENPFDQTVSRDCLALNWVLDLSPELEAHALSLAARAETDDEILLAFQMMASLGLEQEALRYVLHSRIAEHLQELPDRTFWDFCESVAQVHISLGRYQEALNWCNRGLARNPERATGRAVKWQKLLLLKTVSAGKLGCNRIALDTAGQVQGEPWERARYFARLYAGDLRVAWEQSVRLKDVQDLRWLFGEKYGRHDLRLSELRGRALLVISSGGIGDQIRMLGILKDPALLDIGRLTVGCDPRLEALLERSVSGLRIIAVSEYRGFRPGEVHTDRNRLPARTGSRQVNNELYEVAREHDVVLSVFELYRRLRTDVSSFSESRAYLRPATRLTDKWRTRLDALGSRPKVGLSWRSGLLTMARQDEYTRLEEWMDLLLHRGVDVVNLQYELSRGERELLATHRPDTLERWPDLDLKNDIEDLAALTQSLDVVIAPCTTIMELAGAVGGNTLYVSTNERSGWRRRDEEGRDLFFPNVRIVSPEIAGDTAGMIRKALTRMEAMLPSRSSTATSCTIDTG